MICGGNLGRCRKLTTESGWRTELEFAPQLFWIFWIQSSTMDACHSSRNIWTASPVMLIDLFRAIERAVTFLHLNTCSKLREKYSKVRMREIAWNYSPAFYSPWGMADEGVRAALATALHIFSLVLCSVIIWLFLSVIWIEKQHQIYICKKCTDSHGSSAWC